MTKQIGWYTLKEDRIFRNGYETAAWYEDVLVKAGRYPVTVCDYYIEKSELPNWHNAVRGHIDGVCVDMPGTITSDYFGTLFFGVPISNYDNNQNAGQSSHHDMFNYLYEVANSIANDPETPWELFPEYEVREVKFEYDGETHTTNKIFLK